MFHKTGYTSMTSLDLGNNFVIPTYADIQYMFHNCETNGKLVQVIVHNESLKTRILNLGTNNVPDWWNTNNIISVQ